MKTLLTKLLSLLLIFGSNLSANENSKKSNQTDFNRTISVSGKTDVITAKNGKQVINTINGHANVILTRIGKNGKLETFCANNESDIQRFHSGESLNSLLGTEK